MCSSLQSVFHTVLKGKCVRILLHELTVLSHGTGGPLSASGWLLIWVCID